MDIQLSDIVIIKIGWDNCDTIFRVHTINSNNIGGTIICSYGKQGIITTPCDSVKILTYNNFKNYNKVCLGHIKTYLKFLKSSQSGLYNELRNKEVHLYVNNIQDYCGMIKKLKYTESLVRNYSCRQGMWNGPVNPNTRYTLYGLKDMFGITKAMIDKAK